MNSPHDHADRDHTHLHGHAPKNFGFAFAAGTLPNAGLVAAQFLYGIHAHSMALIADAGHNLGDALGLLIAWGAYNLARWEPTERYTYGFRSASILAALVNAAILLIVTGAIVWECVNTPRQNKRPAANVCKGGHTEIKENGPGVKGFADFYQRFFR